MELTVDDGFILAERTYSFDSNSGYGDAWLLKLGSGGDVEWEKSYGDVLWDAIFSFQQTPDGSYIVAGNRYPPGGSQEAWVMKLNSDGEVEWQKFLGGNECDILFSVEQTTDGGYVLAGGTYSYSDVPNFSEVWMVKMFPNGEVDWEKTYGGIYNDVAYSVKQSPDGGYVLSCWTSFSYGDVWVLKTDAYGNPE